MVTAALAQRVPLASLPVGPVESARYGTLMLNDYSAYHGISFGAERDIVGECVFQTGMVGYPESLTDPSYTGQILILTFPLVGNYGVPSREEVEQHLNQLPRYFESSRIHIAALIVGRYSGDYSHYLARSSLSDWLKEHGVPALHGVDTRALTKKLRSQGVMLAKVQFPIEGALDLPQFPEDTKWFQHYKELPFHDPNTEQLVARVSTKNALLYPADPKKAILGKNGRPLTVMAVDVGMKNNQIRCFTSRGVNLKVVPFDHDFVKDSDYDGLFISNGPGDPSKCTIVIERLASMIQRKTKPIFGICLGHQILALAAGAKTSKMKFGNRGHNLPCVDMQTGRCYITSQNHGYAVDAATLPDGWVEYFVNANDGSNEGVCHRDLPYFSVQFHPEAAPGPQDTEFLFDRFVNVMKVCHEQGKLVPLEQPKVVCKPERVNVRKVLILGSGGLSIGQAGEFDYSGSQAIKALKEEGIYTVLINPNIATIQTSKGLADKVYFLPITPDFVKKVIQYERPDGIYVSFGGQTALNVGVKLKDEFETLGVRVLGTPIDTVIVTEDRDLFAQKMAEIGEKCAASASATTVQEAAKVAREIGYPIIVRAAYALGGLGSGFASDEKELIELCKKSFAYSPQVLVERSMKGWKEIEYEVVRDVNDNCITVCNMENFDPLGIHTGDSIVVAPSQTLSDEDYMMLRKTAVNVIRHLGVIGECNIQYALNPESKEYCIIEVNARLSRSSALASKATGYPLAFVAAKLGLGIPLNDLKNSVTKVTCACFEPSLDYVVVKIPRWDLKKFNRVSTKVGSAMKSVGEVMAVGRTFEETIQKAIRSIDPSFMGFTKHEHFVKASDEELSCPSDMRLFAIADGFHSGKYDVEKVWSLTKIDRWFLNKLMNIVNLEKRVVKFGPHELPALLIKQAKQLGFTDRQLGSLTSTSEIAIRKIRQEFGITPFVKQIDTVAAEFPSSTNYLYMTYNAIEHDVEFEDHGVLVIGSGVYRIGSSVEFDWCAVRTVRTLRQAGFKTIMLNYNPETVSTDYDESDRLYFENITLEKALDIYELEASAGVIVSVGGQTPNNISLALHREGVKIFGTNPEQIDGAENRYKFSRMCDSIGVDQPRWKELAHIEEAYKFCDAVGYPVLVRPSYVLSGAAMNVVFSPEDLGNYLQKAAAVSPEHPVVITKFIEGAKEIEMDAVAKNGQLVYHVISEHVENAGVHSGDATLILPPQDLERETIAKIEDATRRIGNALNVTGPFNIQFIAKNNEIKVIECNLRASRSFPFCSKVMGVDMIELSTKAMMDLPFEPYPASKIPKSNYVCVKVPQFSFSRLSGADPVLGVEMASTGEVACFGEDVYSAYLKGLISTGFVPPKKNILLSIGSFKEKQEFLPSVWKLHRLGFTLFATAGTADFIADHGIPVKCLEALDGNTDDQKAEYSLTQHLANNLIDLYINLPSQNKYRRPANYVSKGYLTRRMAIDLSVPLMTNIKCAKLFVEALGKKAEFAITSVDYKSSHEVVKFPGFINVAALVKGSYTGSFDWTSTSQAYLAGGFVVTGLIPKGQANLAESVLKAQPDVLTDYFILADSTSTMDDPSQVNSVYFKAETLVGVESLSSTMSLFTTLAANYPQKLVLVTNAKGAQLASLIFLANINNRRVHVTDVRYKNDIELIVMSKKNGIKLTCDVPVHALFLCKDDYPTAKCLGTREDQNALWESLIYVDCFSVNSLPYELASEVNTNSASLGELAGIEEALPLLLTAVKKGRLTIDDIQKRLCENPRAIFGLAEITQTYIEVEMDRPYIPTDPQKWSAVSGQKLVGKVYRVVVRGKSVLIDGAVPQNVLKGTNIGLHGLEKILTGLDVLPPLPTIKKDTGLLSPQALVPSDILIRRTSAAVMNSASAAAGRLSVDGLKWDHQADVRSRSGERDHSLDRQEQRSNSLISAPIETSVPPDMPQSVRLSFYRQHIISVKQFSRADMHLLFNVAQDMRTIVERHGSSSILAGKVSCNLFYEPSTRTSCSFEAAMLRLGGQVLNVAVATSSVQKGETLADTVRTLGSYSDLLVIRHPESGSARQAAKFSKVPVINAGDGVSEHPTQALLDVFTIREELGSVNGLTITMVGDLKNGRTVHSLVKLLALYDVRIICVSPESLKLPEDIKDEMQKRGARYQESKELSDDILARTDVLYVTRIQKERFANLEDYDRVKDSFRITSTTMAKAKSTMIVMHPLPRVNEIDTEVDFDQRAAYFRQMKYGLYVRMALLVLVLERK